MAHDVSVKRLQTGGGRFITPLPHTKVGYVNQKYFDLPTSDIRSRSPRPAGGARAPRTKADVAPRDCESSLLLDRAGIFQLSEAMMPDASSLWIALASGGANRETG
jgi:hypothetical protein